MTLTEIFENLAFSELSGLGVGNVSIGNVDEKHYDKVLTSVSLGLTALHTRFPLKEEVMQVKLVTGKTSYKLRSEFAVSKAGVNGYILDSVQQPYRDTLLKIEKVTTEADGSMPINEGVSAWSLYTPNMQTLEVPLAVVNGFDSVPACYRGSKLFVTYRANHRILPIGFNGYDASQVEIDLPYAYLEALLYYVGSRLHNPSGLMNDFHAGNSYYAKYEKACRDLETNNIRVDQIHQNDRLHAKGWI